MNVQARLLEREVRRELDWEPQLAASAIGVAATAAGVVTLSGIVKTYAAKVAAERAAKSVKGVHAVVNDVDVKLEASHERTDVQLAESVVHALEWDVLVPRGRIEARVSDSWVRLEGEVDWNYQREAAEDAVRRLTGVKGVSNRIIVKPQCVAEDVKARIEEAIERNAALEAKQIAIEADEGKVVLRGRVHCWAERDAAEAAAWSAPGVVNVEDELVIAP